MFNDSEMRLSNNSDFVSFILNFGIKILHVGFIVISCTIQSVDYKFTKESDKFKDLMEK